MSSPTRMAEIGVWPMTCEGTGMWNRIARLFTIKTKFEAFLVIYGLGLGAVERGIHYLQEYPGLGGQLLFALCPLAVFMAGGRVIDSVSSQDD